MLPGKTLRYRAGISIAALALACALAPTLDSTAVGAPRISGSPVAAAGDFAPGEAIVRFEPGASSSERREARQGAGVRFDSSAGLPRAQVVDIEGSVDDAVRRLERHRAVAYAQPNYRYEALAVAPPNDTFFDQLWGLDDPLLADPGVGVLEAWETTRGAGQVIAVVDTGVDLAHPDIAANLWANPVPGPDVHGFDFVDGDADPDDYDFHGTHVAATAAAVADNGHGIAGVAPEAEIMAVRVLDGDGSGFTSDIAAGISYAAENGADVINLSLGGPAGDDETTEDAVELAAAQGAVVVAAAGNEGVDNDAESHTPCALPQPNLICVAALDRSGSLAGFSSFGKRTVDLAAPGTSILSAKTDYGPEMFSDDFESEPALDQWTTQAFDGGVPWGESDSAASGSKSATDSPGGKYGRQAAGAEFLAESDLYTTNAVDLSGERGCRLHFDAKYEIEPFFDAFYAGAISEAPFGEGESFDGRAFDGTSPGFPVDFGKEEVSIAELDGRDDAHPIFAIVSDSEIEHDGVYVDDARLFCRDETYVDGVATGDDYDRPGAGNYVRFAGTSMAAPHVSGVVALVRAAAPTLSVQEAVDAVLSGASAIPIPDSNRPTATSGVADACKAIAVAVGGEVETACPGSSEIPPPSEAGEEGGTVPPPIPVAPVPQAPNEFEVPPPQSTPAARQALHGFFSRRPRKVTRTRHRTAKAVFRFRSNSARAWFQCRVDRSRWRRCPARFVRRYSLGRHVVRVRARDADGNFDRTPAVYRFRVRRIGR